MGKIIGFWSQYHGHCRVTASMLAAATLVADEGKSVCVTHTQHNMSDLEGMLNFRISDEEEETIYTAAGIDALQLAFKGGFLTRDVVDRATIQPNRYKRFFMLPGFAGKSTNEEEEADIVTKVMDTTVRDTYDYTFIELASGTNDILTQKLLKVVDVIVICLTQNKGKITDYFARPIDKLFEGIGSNKSVICFGDYDKSMRAVDYRNVGRKYGVPAFCIPHSAEYADSISNGDVPGFFLRNEKTLQNAETTDEGYVFLKEAENAAEVIINKAEG